MIQRAAPDSPSPASVETLTQQIGRELLAATRGSASALTRRFWSERLMQWALADEAFKVELFRFIDVFPVLKTKEAVHRHLVEYLERPGLKLPTGLNLGLKAGGLFKGALAATVTSQIESMAQRFIAGETIAEALPVLQKQWNEGIGFSVDLLGEACVSQAEAEVYRARYLEMIEQLAAAAKGWQVNPQLEQDHLGAVPRANVSIKISAMDGHVSLVDHDGSLERLTRSLGPMLERAGALGVFINFDMEHHALKELTIALFKRCCERFTFDAGIALQAYLTSAEEDVRELLEWARAKNRLITVRLIKGAYWDYETAHARLMGWPPPVWQRKSETDAVFEKITALLLRETPRRTGEPGIKLAVGSHNVRSVAHAMALARSLQLPENALEFQALRGMADELKTAIVERGYRLREYVPIGEMIPGMAYLVRRLLENTSNQGWVRAGQSGASDEQLLAPPARVVPPSDDSRPAPANEPPRDFSQAHVRSAFRAGIDHAHVPPVRNDSTLEAMNAAIQSAVTAFPAWRDASVDDRAMILLRAHSLLERRRDELAAVMIMESHKTWAEADADVCEAIDFCYYYARQAQATLLSHPLGQLTGELNLESHEGRGIAAIISPWNFPMSICTGMTVAALVAGNCAIVKPAEQTPGIAKLLCEILWQAGVPKSVLHFLPGVGEVVGAALVRDPRIAIVAFTGSKTVGLDIIKACSETSANQVHIKRPICEMGGKNAIIVDDSADLDEAVLGVRQSAFGFAGQKCSAGSRLILLDAIHDAFLRRLIESTRALVVGDPLDPATDIGPVIDDEAAQKIRHYIDVGKQEATLAYPGDIGNQKSEIKNLIPPHIFTNVLPTHRIAQEEIFGPVLAVLRAKSFDDAIDIANQSVYKLTGGVFSRTPLHLEQARRQFRVGNLYLNRGITGALVGRQPFGGFGLSGVGAKAGGPHYLLQFTDPRVVTENTMRRGFAPDANDKP